MTPEQFSELAQILPEPMLLVSVNGRILSANAPFLEILGTDKNTIIGKSLFDFADSSQDKITEYLQSCAKTRQMLFGSIDLRRGDREISAYRCDGVLAQPGSKDSAALILLRLKPKESAGNKFIWLTQKINELNKELVERKRSEIVLKDSERRFRQLADAMPQMVWTSRPDGYLDYYNRRWYEFTGFPEDEFGDDSWEKILHPEDVKNCVETWYRAVESGAGYEIEYRFKDYRTGDYRWFLGRAEPARDEDGQIIKWYGTCTDINEQKLAIIERDTLLQKEQTAREIAVNANNLKDEFLATVSHELRTPLNAILGWASIAQTSKFDPETINRALEIISRNAKSQNQIIEDILDISRIITGKLILNIDTVALVSVIGAALDSLRPALSAKNIRLKTSFDTKAEIISGDPNRLQQIVWNLVSNAVKFTHPEGEIEVFLKRAGSYAEIIVRDTGDGISPDFLPYVFDRFRQADGTSKRQYGGLGLGLAIVRQLVELHGGSIYADSGGLGLGATFTVKLPLAARRVETAESVLLSRKTVSGKTSDIPEAALAGIKVLVVDDEADARELLKVMLCRYGAEVVTVESVELALNALGENMPHVLVSDIGMPVCDGYELIRRIRNSEPTVALPTVALTAYARKDDRTRALSAGFDDYLAKPVDTAELIKIVARLSDKS